MLPFKKTIDFIQIVIVSAGIESLKKKWHIQNLKSAQVFDIIIDKKILLLILSVNESVGEFEWMHR
jgi:hypothetical protein